MTEAISNTLASAQSILSDTYTSARRAVSSAPPNDAYLRWDAPGVEKPRPERTDEEAKARQIAEVMNRMQQRNFDKHRHAFRATHVKTQGIVKGQLHVLPDLPPHLRQGMFTQPGKTYDVAARYANEPVFLQEDQAPGPRGLSMKVFGVEGARLRSGGDDSTTQDFFFNNAPMLELTDIDTTLDIMTLREKYFDNPTQLSVAIKLRTDALKQNAPATLPNVNLIANEFFTQSAFRFGDFYGHMKLEPVGAGMQEKAAEKVSSGMDREVLKDWMFDWFQGKEAVYDFKVSTIRTQTLLRREEAQTANYFPHRFSSAQVPHTIPQKTAALYGMKPRRRIRLLRESSSRHKTRFHRKDECSGRIRCILARGDAWRLINLWAASIG